MYDRMKDNRVQFAVFKRQSCVYMDHSAAVAIGNSLQSNSKKNLQWDYLFEQIICTLWTGSERYSIWTGDDIRQAIQRKSVPESVTVQINCRWCKYLDITYTSTSSLQIIMEPNWNALTFKFFSKYSLSLYSTMTNPNPCTAMTANLCSRQWQDVTAED